VQFQRYLLPSMLSVEFSTMTDAQTITQFGRDAASLALLNADQLATNAIVAVVPSVSLGHAAVLLNVENKWPGLFSEIKALIVSTTFCKLDGSGKDFERVWVLLVHTVLRLQFIVRRATAASGRDLRTALPIWADWSARRARCSMFLLTTSRLMKLARKRCSAAPMTTAF
jgi:hypothetical protein